MEEFPLTGAVQVPPAKKKSLAHIRAHTHGSGKAASGFQSRFWQDAESGIESARVLNGYRRATPG